MKELLGVLAVIALIAIIVYLRRQSAKTAEQQKLDEFRQMQAKAAAADRAAVAASAPPASADVAPAAGRGLLQEAADRAAGLPHERATDQIETQTSELARAREEAERAAARLSDRAEQALAGVQAAAHRGAVPGDGTHDCPPGYPIKGNMPSQRYHEPGQLSYGRTIPEVCFESVEAAAAAGFVPAHDDPDMRRGGSAGAVVAEEAVLIAERDDSGQIVDAAVAEAVVVGDGGGTEAVAQETVFAMDDVPPGAVRGDGSRDCPPTYPIKASARWRHYHMPGAAAYDGTTPDLCFSSVTAAEGAGFSPMA